MSIERRRYIYTKSSCFAGGRGGVFSSCIDLIRVTPAVVFGLEKTAQSRDDWKELLFFPCLYYLLDVCVLPAHKTLSPWWRHSSTRWSIKQENNNPNKKMEGGLLRWWSPPERTRSVGRRGNNERMDRFIYHVAYRHRVYVVRQREAEYLSQTTKR